MTSPPSMLPVSGEQHEKAIEAASYETGATAQRAEQILAAYFGSLAAQGVRLVDVREVAEWLRSDVLPTSYAAAVAEMFLARFGGGDEG